MRWNTWYSIVPSLLAVFGLLITLAVFVLYISYSQTPVIKASGRELSYFLLVSIALCYLMTFVLLAKPSTFICAIKRIGIGVAFSCLYSSLLVKTNRIHRIFHQSTRSPQTPSCISPISQIFIVASLAGAQLFGSLIWMVVLPPGIRHIYPTRSEVVLTCNVPDYHFLYSLTYDAALILLCTVYAFKTRKLPENFNETKFIGFTMYTTCVLWICWILFFIGTGNDFQIQNTGLCISISMSATVALACIFVPKLYVTLFEKHKNVWKQDSAASMFRRSYRSATYYNECNNGGSHIGSPNVYTALLAAQKEILGKQYVPMSPRASTSSGLPSSVGILHKTSSSGYNDDTFL